MKSGRSLICVLLLLLVVFLQLPLEGGMGICCGHDPFFQASRGSIAYHFTINVPLICPPPPFSIFRKILHLQPCFRLKFKLSRCKISEFLHQDPSFFKGNLLPRLYFWKLTRHIGYPPKKKLNAPSPGLDGQILSF